MNQKSTDKGKVSAKEQHGSCCGCGKGTGKHDASEGEKLEKLKYEVAQEMGLEEEDSPEFSAEEEER